MKKDKSFISLFLFALFIVFCSNLKSSSDSSFSNRFFSALDDANLAYVLASLEGDSSAGPVRNHHELEARVAALEKKIVELEDEAESALEAFLKLREKKESLTEIMRSLIQVVEDLNDRVGEIEKGKDVKTKEKSFGETMKRSAESITAVETSGGVEKLVKVAK